MNISDKMDNIRRKLEQGDLSAAERRALMKQKFNVMSGNDNDVAYRAEGGTTWGEDIKAVGKEVLPDFVKDKLREAVGAGVNPKDAQMVLKNNALKSRNARVRGALLKGGLAGLGKSNENQAGLITQAGINNRSFTPDSALGTIGQGITEAGAADGKYYDELTRIDERAQTRADEQAKEARKNKSAEAKMLNALRKANPHLVRDGKITQVNNVQQNTTGGTQ